MKKVLFILSLFMLSASFSFAQRGAPMKIDMDVIIGNRPPAPREMKLMKAEEANHPNITKSIHEVDNALQHLHAAPDDFGGHKAQAESDLKQAWVSLRKALYYRLYQ